MDHKKASKRRLIDAICETDILPEEGKQLGVKMINELYDAMAPYEVHQLALIITEQILERADANPTIENIDRLICQAEVLTKAFRNVHAALSTIKMLKELELVLQMSTANETPN
jgi:hypothetical protein